MPVIPKHWYKYTDDDGSVMRIRLSEATAKFDSFELASGGEPEWPKPARWVRHVGIRFADGSRVQMPCKDTQGAYKNIGASATCFISGELRTGVIVGRTGERGGS